MRYISIILVALLVFSGVALAANERPSPQASNVMFLSGHGEVSDPPVYAVRVRYGMMDAEAANVNPSLSSGDIVKWDTNSFDGVTISACTAVTDAVAGILLTAAATQDSATFDNDDNFAWMAVGGYCLANLDTSEATAGNILCASEQITPSLVAFGTENNYATVTYISKDIGTLLQDPGSDTLAPVWLNLN